MPDHWHGATSSRGSRAHPGRVVWLVFNVIIAMLLMTLGVFGALERVLGLYANVAIAWVECAGGGPGHQQTAGPESQGVEFRRAYLYDINPVGLGAMGLAVVLSVVAHFGWLGEYAAAFAPFIALFTAMVTAPLLAWATWGRYLARRDPSPWQVGELVRCSVCENRSRAPTWPPAPTVRRSARCAVRPNHAAMIAVRPRARG